MENFETQIYKTETHSEELDNIFNQEPEHFDEIVFKQTDYIKDLKTVFRLIRKKYSLFVRNRMQKNFLNIIYLTLDCPPYTKNSNRISSPLEFIDEIRKQYPDDNISVLLPIINSETIPDKPLFKFEFFIQNATQEAFVYKLSKNKLNINVYGIYSESFSRTANPSEMSKLQNLAPFLKASRYAIKKLGVDIVHSENIPFFLGGEFENPKNYHIKVLQTIKDFTQIDMAKKELFWAAINLADKTSMKKICSDNVIKKLVAALFNLHNSHRFYQMKDCLSFIYKNYSKFRKYIDKGEDIDENIIFNKLNLRISQLFPNISQGETQYFNPYIYTLKRANWWVTISKTYYNDILQNPKLSGKMFKIIEKTKDTSGYIEYGLNTKNYPKEETRTIYQTFNLENFRQERGENKTVLLKEFDIERIKTNFIDPTLFRDEEVKIHGFLDSSFDSPLLFANPNSDIYANGVDVLFNSILKLFEIHKSFRLIISIKNGMKNNYIKSWVEFLQSNKHLDGKWVFIDGEIILPKFLAASDMILIPTRTNPTSTKHLLAMHYGCVPIVSRCGVLNDTIPDIFDDITNGCGFKTKESLLTEKDNTELFLTPLMKAMNVYQNNPASWNSLIKNCLNREIGWNFKMLEKYDRIYKELI